MNIYVHVPFCRSKCAYCGFLSHCDIGLQDKYIDTLCEEIEFRLVDKKTTLATIYFGGGTPSLISPINISKVLKTLEGTSNFSKNIEITLEVNPEDITKDNLKSWKNIGISRVSIGIQSLNDDVRNTIHRSLSGSEVLERIKLAQRYFNNISVDLISGLPSEDLSSFRANILKIIDLGIGHISVYDLEIPKGSQFYNNPRKYNFISEDKELKLLTTAWRVLEDSGYEQYEISNFAKDKKYCRHNLDFWLGKDYLGFGLGAVSKIGNRVLENQNNIINYLENPIIAKKTILGNKGVEIMNISSIIRLSRPLPYARIDKFSEIIIELVGDGYLDRNFVITQKGRLFNNYILGRFTSELLS